MKRFLYNNYTKFIAFILCAVCAAAAAHVFTLKFLDEDNIYMFENSYEESRSAGDALSEEYFALVKRLEQTVDAEGKYHVEKLAAMPAPERWEYYIKIGDASYTNTNNMTYADFERGALAIGTKMTKNVGGVPVQDAFAQPYSAGYCSLDPDGEPYEIAIRMGKDTAAENKAAWRAESEKTERSAAVIITLLALSAIMAIYLLCATGRKYGEEKVQMMLIDKLFVEVTFALLMLTLAGGLCVAYGVFRLIAEMGVGVAHMLVPPSVFAIVSLVLLFVLSLVRNLKNGTFMNRSLIAKICRWTWKTAKKIVLFLIKILKILLNRIKKVLSEIKTTMYTVSSEHFGGRFMGIMIIVFSLGVFILSVLTMLAPVFIVFLAVFVIGAVVFAAKRLTGFESLKDGIEKIKDGDLNHKIEGCPDGVIGAMASNVNSIGEGLQKSLEREVRAERMKSELITNVSHDLKTPLTSIINYTDLLSKEKLTPPEANDYVKIIKQKSERLKQLTSDLFDISKVQSGNEEFNIEDIDLCLLINQAMAELGEQTENSGLTFKLKTDAKEIFIKADGKKVSRVFENLLVNCVKYSMKNTRVYISIAETAKGVSVEIKNIAGYEMDFDEKEITERFVRGDSARSTEGSGLGLAIVKSYVEGCGGAVEIKKDGDLFKVILEFTK